MLEATLWGDACALEKLPNSEMAPKTCEEPLLAAVSLVSEVIAAVLTLFNLILKKKFSRKKKAQNTTLIKNCLEKPNFGYFLCEETRSFRYVEESTSLISKSTLDC